MILESLVLPEELFDIDLANLVNLQRFYSKAPKQFIRAANSTLNSFAFGTRRKSIEIIEKELTIRNQKFTRGSLRVQKSTASNLSSARAEVGSIRRPRFTGWKEQELGSRPERTRSITRFARGTKNRRLRPSFRMRPGSNFLDEDDFQLSEKGVKERNRSIVMLQILRRRKHRKPFVLRSGRFKPGLYVFRRKKVKRIQTFKDKRRIKRVAWMSGGRREFFRDADIDQIWAESLRRVLRF
jgi:hypothetical protein